jgi:hypothetical protein
MAATVSIYKLLGSRKKMINLCRIVTDLDGQTKKADTAEHERRIRIDKELLAARQAELGE